MLKKIALDFDNVLADTMTGWIKYYNKKYDKNLKKSDITLWKFWELESICMNRESAYKIFDIVWEKWQELKPLEENIGLIVDKLTYNAEIHIVTAALGDLAGWLNFYGIKYHKLVKTEPSQKAELDYDIFIDDSPDDALMLGEKKKTCLLYNQPWNQPDETKYLYSKYDTIFRITRLEGVLEFLTIHDPKSSYGYDLP